MKKSQGTPDEKSRKLGPSAAVTICGRRFGFCVCHRLPERSFSFRGHLFPLCARCTGIVAGSVLAPAAFFTGHAPEPLLAALFLLPLIADGLMQRMKWRQSTNNLRFVTGMLFGLGYMTLILQMLGFAAGAVA
jgi:uncharacterized membrane protein